MLIPDQNQELLDQLVEEFTLRLRQGERPAIQEFLNRHPELEEEIEELLTSVAMIEELKTQSNSNTNSLKMEMKEILRLERIGDYRIVRELGRGGMGIVFEAVHESLGRRVAIKVMPNRNFDDEKYLERFKREAQAAANLHHTNIVSVFGMGQAGDHHYYVMEYVDGESLSQLLTRLNGLSEAATENRLDVETVPHVAAEKNGRQGAKLAAVTPRRSPAEIKAFLESTKQRCRWAARIGLQIADGLAYAHGLGTFHRDIKPSNLLIDKNETVWLTDFGLVKNIRNQSITKTGDIIGTPQYMAPESFEGRYDERSETYCLGLTLYEMATLKPAYENTSTPELIRQITTTSPPAPRKIDRQIPRDLSRIIQKAISREPGYRYRKASELRDDLRAFLDDRPISATRISMTNNIWRWSRRNPLSASLAIATGVMICLVAITATIALNITNRSLRDAQEQTRILGVEKRVASASRERAEQSMDFAVGLFDEMFRGLILKGKNRNLDVALDNFDQLTGVSTTVTESDAEFLDHMLSFYLQFGEQNMENSSLRNSSANSFRRVANIYHLTGDFEKAEEAYVQSIQVYDIVHKESPESSSVILEMARTLNEYGQVLELQGSFAGRKQALDAYTRACKLLEHHLNTDEFLQMARKLSELGQELELQESSVNLKKALDTYSRVSELFENRRKMDEFSEVSRTLNEYGEALESQQGSSGRKKALDAYGQAREQLEYQLKMQWARTLVLIGTPQISHRVEIPERFESLLPKSPSDKNAANYRNFVARARRSSSGVAALQFANFENAQRAVEQANQIADDLLAMPNHAQDSELLLLKGIALTRRAAVQLKRAKTFQSRRTLASAIEIIETLMAENPGEADYKFVLAQIHALRFGFGSESQVKSLKKSKKILQELVGTYERNFDYRQMLADVCFRLGLLFQHTGNLDLAAENFELANDLFQKVVSETPRSRKIQRVGTACLLQLVDVKFQSQGFDAAVECLTENIERLESTKAPQNKWPTIVRTMAYRALASLYRDEGQLLKAKATMDRARLNPRTIRKRRAVGRDFDRSSVAPN